ncbi:hypothetical protein DPMN_055077 [Dreissena polymorpha]|uniref:Uncharacterized protein n=1 Tax=Dreissena polymorpha TaxID=45954 RepID=A0A9D4HRX3_DREPO|nr:hypothetical protein DPMN_055077 [Dreissena polymorpha]
MVRNRWRQKHSYINGRKYKTYYRSTCLVQREVADRRGQSREQSHQALVQYKPVHYLPSGGVKPEEPLDKGKTFDRLSGSQ